MKIVEDELDFDGMKVMVAQFMKCADADNIDVGDDGGYVCQ